MHLILFLQAAELNKELEELEEKLDAAESLHQELTNKLAEAEKSADENDQAKKTLENRGNSDSSKLERLQEELDVLNQEIAEIEEQNQELKLQGK